MALEKILKNSSGVPTGEYERIAGGTLWADSPIGTILAYGGTSAPAGWMICNGTSLLRASYPELFAVIGTAFGSADSTHFNIPDLRGEFLRGAGTNSHSGQGDGGSVGDHQDATEIAPPNVGSNYVQILNLASNCGFKNSDNNNSQSLESYADTSQMTILPGGGAKVAFVRPTNTSVNYIIKAVQVALPADLEAQVGDAVEETIGWTLIKKVTSSSSYSTTFAIPNNYNELLAVCGTPYYQFSDVIPQSIMDSSGQFSGYHQTGFNGASMSQQYCYTLGANGNFTSPTVIQNGADNAGFFALYYR